MKFGKVHKALDSCLLFKCGLFNFSCSCIFQLEKALNEIKLNGVKDDSSSNKSTSSTGLNSSVAVNACIIQKLDRRTKMCDVN